MTTITMEKHILKRLDALEDFAKEIRAALAAPATTPEQPRPFIPWSKEAEMLESWAAQPERKPPQGDAMTTREAFETEAKKHGFILDRLDKSGEYVQLITEQAWNIWQAATAAALEAPAQPERKPMTDDETLALFDRVKVRMLFTDAEVAPFASGVAAAEHFHGIGDKP